MVDQTNSENLSRRVRRLEALTFALLVSGTDDGWDDEAFHLLRRFLRRERDMPREYWDREWVYLLEHLMETRRRSQPESLLQEVQGLEKKIREQGTVTESVQLETHTFFSLHSLGVPLADIRLTRYLPVRAYIPETPSGSIESLTEAISELLNVNGFVIADDFPAVKGSWFKKWFAKSSEALSQPEVVERLEKIERAVQIRALDQPQAEIDDKQAAAISKLVKALHHVPNAAVQAGSVLVVKLTTQNGPVIQARTLSQKELIEIENNQMLLQDPAEVLGRLSDACGNTKRSAGRKQIPKSG